LTIEGAARRNNLSSARGSVESRLTEAAESTSTVSTTNSTSVDYVGGALIVGTALGSSVGRSSVFETSRRDFLTGDTSRRSTAVVWVTIEVGMIDSSDNRRGGEKRKGDSSDN